MKNCKSNLNGDGASTLNIKNNLEKQKHLRLVKCSKVPTKNHVPDNYSSVSLVGGTSIKFAIDHDIEDFINVEDFLSANDDYDGEVISFCNDHQFSEEIAY